ncbi:MAG TPA: UDP-3-O-(3-hydroxymyristoyl)glucosamine N-acyltransferase, partial [Planctomycetota bacterium]|nr:UDP-3-O-(3-hydroxymyristoyl)glucosamine N-acyltransferase [Planctomycetota bacterium]
SGAHLVGDGSISVDGAASLTEATPSQVSFCALPRYATQLDATRAAAVVVPPALMERRGDLPRLVHPDPNVAFTHVCAAFATQRASPAPGVHPTAFVDAGARLADDVHVGPLCSVGAGADLGAGCVLHAGVHVGADCVLGPGCELFPGAVLYPDVRLGARVRVHAGAVIGCDGFGYEPPQDGGGAWSKIPHVGTVELGDDVEVGAACTIDRARFGITRLEAGVKLDNQVHVAHNCTIGAGSMLAAQVGLSGSTSIGRGVLLGGQSATAGHMHIGDGARIGGQSGVIGNVDSGAELWGTPARPRREVLKQVAELRRLGEVRQRLEALERRLARREDTTEVRP